MGGLITIALPLALALIMFSLGIGLTLQDFKRVATQPFAFTIGAVGQLIIVPLVAFAFIATIGMTGELAVGFMILSFCPGGVTSNMLSKLANGDVALSVSLTAVISLLSMFTVPILVAWAVGHFMGADAPDISIGGLAISMFLITALPVLLGVAIRHFALDFASKAEPILGKIATVLFVVIVLAALAANWSLFVENFALLGPGLIIFNIILIALGALIAKFAGLGPAQLRTIAIETGIQNSTIGITLGSLIAAQAVGFSAFSLPSAVYGITMYFVALPAIVLFRRSNGTAT